MPLFSSFPRKGENAVTNKSPNISGPAISGTERGRTSFYGHYLGVIKDVFDPSHMGIVRVYIPEMCGLDPQDSARWINCSYASPFMNTTPPADKNLPQQSSGLWATPVDVNQSVIVIFIKGDVNQAFYIASVPEAYQNRDIAGSAPNIKDDKDPLARTNPDRTGKTETSKSSGGVSQADNYKRINAGLGVDSGRSPPSGPTMNTPSSSIVLSSPGNKVGPNTKDPAINPMGFTQVNYNDIEFIDGGTHDGTTTQRSGGHTIRLEDDVSYEHLGLISRSGHQIIMNDTKGCIYINSANGNNWIELTKDGKIDIYARDSVSIRTQADFNFYADRDFNVHAGRYINLVADEHLTTNARKTSMYTAENHNITTKQKLNIKSIEDFTLECRSYSLKAIQDSMLDALPGNLLINCKKSRTAHTVRPHKLAATTGGPESFIRRIPMPEPWPDHETKYDNNWQGDNSKRGSTSPTLTDMDPLFGQGNF
jgi:hypothetical protein